ncbi:hypothetical protein BU24DRAFT_460809 [Aaosphaeria arxii CBS 175.79]|uniref:F-box domain-containing protein n=1 Tax=Aaosphaeria arxii CBS 175.79 TaxID=1450172 RepID=A0A6A5XWU2_9PLEO|nr:uncharacterized protein BU24DRAFT_460809 [Aaosphaeria arxii CBS 175.79]KAF2017815.1 hypothetical protein BU24DRAFT_460809 [Aaosphaeria arxii CBS 175.79]
MRLHDLPDDVLIPIFACCDIDSLFAARLVSRPLRSLIDGYIRTIAPSVAANTFPRAASLLKRPEKGYSLRWLRGLIPAHLAAIALDKDKLRRHSYVNAGFPYGIPFENDCPEAMHWRTRVAKGWRLLRGFYLISRDVYAKSMEELEHGRPKMFRRVSNGMRTSSLWQNVSCPYQACTEHGVWGLFDNKKRRESDHCPGANRKGHEGDWVEEARKRETLILKKRLEWLETLSNQDLMDYLCLWRLLMWVFRPYRRPESTVLECVGNRSKHVPKSSFKAEISGILHGCSWLNWLVLHIGTTPFWRQWWAPKSSKDANAVRDLVWSIWSQRSHHQVELEREFVAKFEFVLRKRCLSSDRVKRLEDEIATGRVVKTISLDCIPWEYDQPPIISRTPSDFPWYEPSQYLWMSGNIWMVLGSPGRPLGVFKYQGDPSDEEMVAEQFVKGSLDNVQHLVYLGLEDMKMQFPLMHFSHWSILAAFGADCIHSGVDGQNWTVGECSGVVKAGVGRLLSVDRGKLGRANQSERVFLRVPKLDWLGFEFPNPIAAAWDLKQTLDSSTLVH